MVQSIARTYPISREGRTLMWIFSMCLNIPFSIKISVNALLQTVLSLAKLTQCYCSVPFKAPITRSGHFKQTSALLTLHVHKDVCQELHCYMPWKALKFQTKHLLLASNQLQVGRDDVIPQQAVHLACDVTWGDVRHLSRVRGNLPKPIIRRHRWWMPPRRGRAAAGTTARASFTLQH